MDARAVACWDELKAADNHRKHGISLEEAATVFDDPLFVLQDARRIEQPRDAVIGFSSAGRLLTVVHIEVDGDYLCLARFGGRGSFL